MASQAEQEARKLWGPEKSAAYDRYREASGSGLPSWPGPVRARRPSRARASPTVRSPRAALTPT
jgi:hypothetical protein